MYMGISDTQLQPPYAIDGSETTRYTTARVGNGSEWFQVDLCRAVSIAGVNVYTANLTDVAAAYSIQVSTDGSTWTTVVNSTMPAQQRMALTFAPAMARYVRMNQLGTMLHWWSLHEFAIVCGP
jgi:hypothetical protein